MNSAIFYVDGKAVRVQLSPAISTVKPTRRVLRGWVVVAFILAAAILAGSGDSWANPRNSSNQQDFSQRND